RRARAAAAPVRPPAGGAVEPVGGRDHPAGEPAGSGNRIPLVLQTAQRRHCVAEEPPGLPHHGGGLLDAPPAGPALDVVGARTGEPGEGGAQEPEEVAAAPAQPGKAEEAEE